MTQIDARDNLAAIIRRQVSSLAKLPAGVAANARIKSDAPTKQTASLGGGDIAAIVARRVAAIDSKDPHRSRRAFRVFLESVLLAELGEDLINDAGFHRLVDDVHAHMNADSVLASDIQRAADLMLAATPKTAS